MDGRQPTRRRVHTAVGSLAGQQQQHQQYQLHYRRHQPPQQPAPTQQQQQQHHELESDDSSHVTATLNLTDGVLRDDQGQLIQLITINNDGQQEYLDHTTLTGGDIITGQLTSGMLVNYSTDDLQQQDSQHEPIVIDAFAGSEDDGDIVELYHSEPQQLHVDDQQSYARAGRNGGILQFANTSMTIASIVDGGARNGTHVIVPNAYCNRAAKPRQTTASQMPPPPLTPIRRGRRSDVEHSHTVTEPNQQTILIVQRTPAIHSASLSNVITMADQTQLPHKKRHTAVARSPETRSQLTTSAPVRSPAAPSPPPALAFQCQLCSLPCTSQLDFFRHLQSHYETAPAPTDADEGAPHAIKEEANEVLIDDPAADVVAVQQAKIEMDVEVVVARPKRERRAMHKTPQTQAKKSRPPTVINVLSPAEPSHRIKPDDHRSSVALHAEQSEHMLEFDSLAQLIEHQDQSELDDNGPQAAEENDVMMIRLNDAAEDGGHGDDDGDADVMDIYALHQVDEVDEDDDGNGATIDGASAVEGEWFEEGEMSEEIMYDVAVDAEEIGNEIEVIPEQIGDDIAIKPEPSDSSPTTITTKMEILTCNAISKNAPPTRKRTYNKKTTLASQMDCFEEIIAVVPVAAADADGTSATATGRRATKRGGGGADAAASTDADGRVTAKSIITKTFKCRLCDKVCKTKNSLHYHFLLHTGERPHKCAECGKGFFANSALKVHQRLHTGDKPYQCEVCSRAFRQWGDLRYHMSSLHSDEKNHQCEFCGKDFARRYSLVIHRRIHTGERNYKCEFCDKSFRASTYLQDHRRIHTGEKPFECEFCQKRFRVRGDLKRHWNIHTRKPKEEMTLESLVLEATDNEGEGVLADASGTVERLEVVELLLETASDVEQQSGQFADKPDPLEGVASVPTISRCDEQFMAPSNKRSTATLSSQPRKVAVGGRNMRANAANRSQ